ncbi:M1 family metallopeptidase [Reichenbachiella sp. MSK19-1]|uniref:M1 family metallopeptidase n=1 Tax=Reichenbachiella sp. MSK19-1 TaxID=1897631 RepID=UPI000E6C5922|nr:M1 family metallopeptidase [Reichenbachiella sp. MSK19-1]RJE71864.1 peptidase M1 [Reichenbachiella sp. MSK19-1]
MRYVLLSLLLFAAQLSTAQTYDRQDSLRGTITPERVWWDLTYYHLTVEVLPERKSLVGSNLIQYEVLEPHQVIQVDLQPPLKITQVTQDGKVLDFKSEGNAHFISLQKEQKKGATESIVVTYSGQPREAVHAPWDGGISWKKDEKGKHFIASSCQGLGASVWWPCKDHMYDEVDSMLISVEVPKGLIDVSNGRLVKTEENKKKKTKTYHWAVSNPINNYGVNINIGNYTHWHETYAGEKGTLDIDNWVLRYNEKKARAQFKENHRMLEAFEHWFGPYPFYEDGFKLVEAPYLGMEHQSSVTYGNKFANGYLGRDLSGTGWGLKFDFIIIHESGHEWFANNITHRDAADMWIHESFTAYSEGIFVEYFYGTDAGREYVRGTRMNIANAYPVIGDYGINAEHHDSDVYYKGANMLNTLRSWINDDVLWREILRGLGEEFYHQTVTSQQIENYISQKADLDLAAFFDQYLRDTRLPILEYYSKDEILNYRWTNTVDGFNMPIQVTIDGVARTLTPQAGTWQQEMGTALVVDPNYYIAEMKIK